MSDTTGDPYMDRVLGGLADEIRRRSPMTPTEADVDARLGEIRERHSFRARSYKLSGSQCHRDRGWLLALVAELRRENEKMRAELTRFYEAENEVEVADAAYRDGYGDGCADGYDEAMKEHGWTA